VPIESLVADGLLNRQLPILRERLLKGYETIDFGPLRLEPEGVGKGSSLLRWEDVDFVGMEDGAVFVRKKDKMLIDNCATNATTLTAVMASWSSR
jgi:hypothetical protein